MIILGNNLKILYKNPWALKWNILYLGNTLKLSKYFSLISTKVKKKITTTKLILFCRWIYRYLNTKIVFQPYITTEWKIQLKTSIYLWYIDCENKVNIQLSKMVRKGERMGSGSLPPICIKDIYVISYLAPDIAVFFLSANLPPF